MSKLNPQLFEARFDYDEELGTSGISDKLRTEILETREKYITKLSTGHCKSMESYADAVGYLRGLDFVLGHGKRHAQELNKIAIEDDEEEHPLNVLKEIKDLF